MITYRLRGLIHLHVFATAMMATAYFLLLVLGVEYLPFIALSQDVNILLYAIVVFFALLLSGRFWAAFGGRFHSISWIDAAAITARQTLILALAAFTLVVATKDQAISRLFLAFFLASGSIVLLVFNRFIPGHLSRAAFQQNHRIPAVFIGPPGGISRLDNWIRQQSHVGVRMIGILSEAPQPERDGGAIPWLGKPDLLAQVIEERGVGQVVLLGIPEHRGMTQFIVETCQTAGCRLLIHQDFWDRLPIPMAPIIEGEHLFLTVYEEPLEDPFNRATKRVYDIAVSLPVVLFILPLLCLLVWSMQMAQARGPLFFTRPRGGQRRREFRMLKFRSMYESPEDDASEAQQARHEDPRVYPFGAFMRKTSLDEFPQFWNVLVGDMSIVGPRPHLAKHDTEFSLLAKTYRTRQLVKPGITGLAQVSGYRGEISAPEGLRGRLKLDIHYITNWSIWLDIQITLKTFLQMIFPPRSAR